MDAFDDAIKRSIERTVVVKIILTEPPTGKRKQYDKEGEEMTNERVQSQAGLSYAKWGGIRRSQLKWQSME